MDRRQVPGSRRLFFDRPWAESEPRPYRRHQRCYHWRSPPPSSKPPPENPYRGIAATMMPRTPLAFESNPLRGHNPLPARVDGIIRTHAEQAVWSCPAWGSIGRRSNAASPTRYY